MSAAAVENLLKSALNTAKLESYGRGGGGCINEGEGFLTDHGPVFVKKNRKSEAKRMFDGEYASLEALCNTRTIRVPRPLAVVENTNDGGALLATEYIEMSNRRRFSRQFGTNLARLHLHNSELMKTVEQRAAWVGGEQTTSAEAVHKFGFHTVTCCGYIPQSNDWSESWLEFFVRNRLKVQVDMLVESCGDRELKDLWPKLERAIPSIFDNSPAIVPSLLHGDLWSGNCAETQTEPVIFDPASFYGHSEYEFGIATMFGGFNREFYQAYHELIPKTPGFDRRVELYQLFHHLNHWNHFGSGYRSSSLSLMRSFL